MSDEPLSEAEAEAVMATIAKFDEILDLSDSVKPMFAGRAPEVVSGVLADLMAIWLTGFVPEEADDLHDLRRGLFRDWSRMFWTLVEIEDILRRRH